MASLAAAFANGGTLYLQYPNARKKSDSRLASSGELNIPRFFPEFAKHARRRSLRTGNSSFDRGGEKRHSAKPALRRSTTPSRIGCSLTYADEVHPKLALAVFSAATPRRKAHSRRSSWPHLPQLREQNYFDRGPHTSRSKVIGSGKLFSIRTNSTFILGTCAPPFRAASST